MTVKMVPSTYVNFFILVSIAYLGRNNLSPLRQKV